jgi:hypothetical protein
VFIIHLDTAGLSSDCDLIQGLDNVTLGGFQVSRGRVACREAVRCLSTHPLPAKEEVKKYFSKEKVMQAVFVPANLTLLKRLISYCLLGHPSPLRRCVAN